MPATLFFGGGGNARVAPDGLAMMGRRCVGVTAQSVIGAGAVMATADVPEGGYVSRR